MQNVAAVRPRSAWSGYLPRLLECAALALTLTGAVWLRTYRLDNYTGSFDEGIRAQQLLLMSAGYRPFRDIFASQGPLLLDLLYPFYVLFGETLAAARAGVVVCSLVALLGAWWIARLVAGPAGGLAAVVILGLSPAFLEGSRLALAEVPTIAPALLALASLLAYRRRGNRGWLVASAACAALALLIKPMVLHLGAPVAVLLLVPRADPLDTHHRPRCLWSRVPVDLAIYGAAVVGLCTLTIWLLGPAQVWDNLGAYRSGAGSGAGANARENFRLTLNIMRGEQAGLYALTGAGMLLGLWRRPLATCALLAWIFAVLALFAVYGDLADKHIVYLVPPVALLAVLGAGLGFEQATRVVRQSARDPGTTVAVLVGAIGVLAYLWSVAAIYRADIYLLRVAPEVAATRRDRAADEEIAGIIAARTPADGWVLSDNPLAAFDARRKAIPYLVDTSGTRIDAGSLTTRLATAYIERYQPSVIVTWPRRLGKLDDLTRALPAMGYRLEKTYEIGWKVYVRE